MTALHVIQNADVRTMDASGRRAEAVAWRDGKIVAVGTRAEVAGPEATVWDAGGATVLPGFVDAHHHAFLATLMDGGVRLRPPGVCTIADLQRALSAASAQLPPGAWLVASEWDEALLAERRAPTRRELDDAVPDRPLLAFHYSCHRALANSRALEAAGIDKHTPDPSGGLISRGPDGLPDGLLIERGMSRVEIAARANHTPEQANDFFARLAQHHDALLAAGITRIADAAVPADLMVLYREAARRGFLRVPTVMMPVSARGTFEAPWDVLEGPVTGEEEGLLTVGALKLIFDGAPVCAMCVGWRQMAGAVVNTLAMGLRQRSFDSMRTMSSARLRFGRDGVRTGINIYRREEARAVIRAATERGFAVATHAIGNDAIDIAVSAYEATGSAVSRIRAPRIEHAVFLSRPLVARMANAGVLVVAQPHFLALPAMGTAARIPGIANTALRWLLDAKIKVAGSSDYPVASFDPLDGIRSAVHRRTLRGHVNEPEQRIALDEALTMYTRTSAEACGALDRCGTLEAGKRADIVVLDGPLASDLKSVRVRATVLGGDVAFGQISSRASAPRENREPSADRGP
ncbi:amidohydrolase [Pendulispora brunnea]|uniref:Amidohydrolase n=1 Tax=Pendulispora brunnea TaxID=2905690 RepID=A0ABZ2KQ08_9BACT